MAFFEAKDLVKKYSSREVVKKVSLEFNPGEIVGLLGPNGAGKTTVFYMLVGLISPNSGEIYFDQKNVTSKPLYKRASLGVGYLSQESSLLKKLSVFDNIALAFEGLGLKSSEVKKKSTDLIDQFGLSGVAQNLSSTLSGGERRRCEIARCLAINPKFVLLDEPFAGVDPIAVAEIKKFILDLKKRGIGVVITDHNVRETLKTCDRGYLMREGEIFFSGTPEQISSNSLAQKYYLGEDFSLQ